MIEKESYTVSIVYQERGIPMNTFSRLEWILKTNHNYAIRYSLLFSACVFSHALLVVVFAVYGRPLLAALNAVSILLYCIWGIIFTRRPINDLLLVLPYFVILLHTGLYNLLLGSTPAFYLYTFAVIPSLFFYSTRDAHAKNPAGISLGLALGGIILMFITLLFKPLRPLEDAGQSASLFQINLLMSSLIICALTGEYLTDTRSTQKALSHIAEYDQLTGLRNRYSLQKQLKIIHGTQYCVIMADVDDFKQVNDTHGHAVGDQLLARIGKVLQSCIRQDDIACRWGGEEFLLVIHADLDAARAITERIRRKLHSVVIEAGDARISATMTFGIANCMEADSFDKVTAIADSNLLRGKACGKNRVVVSSDVLETITTESVQPELDTSYLDGVIFSAFAATSDTTYLYLCNMNTNVSRWSKTAVDYFGLPGEYMYDAGNVWLGFIHPDDREAYSKDINDVFSGKKNRHDITYRARNKYGEYIICSCKGIVTDGDASHPPLFAGTMTNLGIC